jgi:hypothetical protein
MKFILITGLAIAIIKFGVDTVNWFSSIVP